MQNRSTGYLLYAATFAFLIAVTAFSTQLPTASLMRVDVRPTQAVNNVYDRGDYLRFVRPTKPVFDVPDWAKPADDQPAVDAAACDAVKEVVGSLTVSVKLSDATKEQKQAIQDQADELLGQYCS